MPVRVGREYGVFASRWRVAFGLATRWVIVTACTGSGAQWDVVASGRLYDSPDRIHNDRRLVDRDNVTGLLRRDQTSTF
jgi:hypothetical protein